MAKPIIRYKPVATPDKVRHKMKLPGTSPRPGERRQLGAHSRPSN